MSAAARTRIAVFVLAMLLASLLPGVAAPAAAQEYTLETQAEYVVRPDDGEIDVTVGISFTNTTPDPPGQFSVFDEIRLAVHDQASGATASDADGALDVEVAMEEGVNVATVALRDELRYEETATLEMAYTLSDTDDPQMRVRPSLIVFPAWGFGTASEVSVSIPAAFEVRTDGDPLSEEGGTLVSGPIEDPAQWLSLVTAVRPVEFASFEATVPLNGGTADLVVRAFADDEAWGERTLSLVEAALPRLEEEIGLPYPRHGPLVLSQAVAVDGSAFGEEDLGGTEIRVAFDEPPFTALHQVSHVWLASPLIEARWIREGMASEVAARVAEPLEVETPYDPVEEAEAQAEAAFPLDAWPDNAGVDADIYGYAASWATIDEIEAVVGPDGLRRVLARVAASLGPYQAGEVEPQPDADDVASPANPLTTRAFLDHLETVSGADLSDLFAERVLTGDDVALLPARADARSAFDALVRVAGAWGAPDPIRGTMTSWSFDDAESQIADALGWLERRDVLLEHMADVGLSAPDRLRQAYQSHGGGPEAVAELEAEEAVVDAYASTAEQVNAERSLLERVGLIGGPDPARELALANGRFADGDLRGSLEAVQEAQRILAAAEMSGIVRVASAVLVVVILLGLAVVLFRRRASYTSSR